MQARAETSDTGAKAVKPDPRCSRKGHSSRCDDINTEPSPECFQKGVLHFCGGLWVCAGGLDTKKLTKTQLIYSVSCFNLGGLGALFGGISSQKPPVATGLYQHARNFGFFSYTVVCRDGFGERRAFGHLSFWGPSFWGTDLVACLKSVKVCLSYV